MAFNRAAGHNNLPSANFTPEIFSQKVLKFFRRASVAEDITNTDYAGEIENYGDTVRIIKEPTITVSAYARGSVVNPQDLADDQTTMVVDQANAFAFKIDDIEERQSHVNFEALATSSGAYSLKRKYDSTSCKQLLTVLALLVLMTHHLLVACCQPTLLWVLLVHQLQFTLLQTMLSI